MLLSRSQTALVSYPSFGLVKERIWRPVDALNSVSITKLNPMSSSFRYKVSLNVSMKKPRCNKCLKASITLPFLLESGLHQVTLNTLPIRPLVNGENSY